MCHLTVLEAEISVLTELTKVSSLLKLLHNLSSRLESTKNLGYLELLPIFIKYLFFLLR